MEVFLVYLWLKLDSFAWTLFFVSIILCFSIAIYGLEKSNICGEGEKELFVDKWWKPTKRATYTGLFCFLIFVLMPSSKETAILIGASYAVDFAKSPEGAKIGQLIRKKANDFLDEELKEIKPANKAVDSQ